MNKTKIEKAPGATTNTYVSTVRGISTFLDTYKSQHINASVMFTSDEYGETLSVFDPSTKKQIVIPFEQVENLIEHTRQKRNQEG